MSFRADAAERIAPSMRRRINLARLYRTAREQVQAATYGEREPLPSPEACPLNLDQLLDEPRQALEAVLAGPPKS